MRRRGGARGKQRGRSLSELHIQRCETCGVALFPDRLRCPRCRGRALTRVPAGPGLVEQETALRRQRSADDCAIRLGSVRLDVGPVIIARLESDANAGANVRLTVEQTGAIWARARH
jgi:uncharacterized OB-fold protein